MVCGPITCGPPDFKERNSFEWVLRAPLSVSFKHAHSGPHLFVTSLVTIKLDSHCCLETQRYPEKIVRWCWEETRAPTAFQRTWSIQTMQKLWFIIPSNRTTSQPTTRGSKSDNLTWLKPGLYFKGRYCHRVVPSQDRACQDHWPEKTHTDIEKSISQLRKSHFQKHHLRQFEGCIFFVEISMFFSSTCEAETRTEKMKVSSWFSTFWWYQQWDSNGWYDWWISVQQRLVHCCDFCGQGKLAQDFGHKKIHLRSPVTWCAAEPSRLLHWWQGKIRGVDFHGMGSLVQLGIFSEFVRLGG